MQFNIVFIVIPVKKWQNASRDNKAYNYLWVRYLWGMDLLIFILDLCQYFPAITIIPS